ncbi:hypothetical protein KAR91_19915 [Candidatus Pacearchaeota archaeon]|nr:hypothetical protein [Candidatus Pacearchaeota archaeon]
MPEGKTRLTKAVRNSILAVLFLSMTPGSCVLPASCASYLAAQLEEKKEEAVKIKAKVEDILKKDGSSSVLALEGE